jgi:hypothetical protein
MSEMSCWITSLGKEMPSWPLYLDKVPFGPVAAHIDVGKIKNKVTAEPNLAVEGTPAAESDDAVPELDVRGKKLMNGLFGCPSIEEGSKLTDRSSNVLSIEVKPVLVFPRARACDLGRYPGRGGVGFRHDDLSQW